MAAQYDGIIIGAGMSGLAAGIRLAMFDKKVCILEKHSIPGGLNSYYQRRNQQAGGIRLFDVGLHALTNFASKGERNKPFTKLLKQLRLNYDDFKLMPQSYSKIQFADNCLKFSNDFELLRSEVFEKFPKEKDNFEFFVKELLTFNETDLSLTFQSARQKLNVSFKDDLLKEMILAPLLIYGSAWEHDMDYAQFVIMFKSIYLEGFSRPEGGVRTIIKLLMDKYLSLGGEIRFKSEVSTILQQNNKACGVRLASGEELMSEKIFSSMGVPETYQHTQDFNSKVEVGQLSFMETLIVTDKKIPLENEDATIIFYNESDTYHYQKPQGLFDKTSAVVCFPDNYDQIDRAGEGMIRVTFMANYHQWKNLTKEDYIKNKEDVYTASLNILRKLVPSFNNEIYFKDVFSPTTVEKYTSHLEGTVYGSTDKRRDGKTEITGLYIIGTDQGFLGIVGAMLSGISIGNLYGLMES